MDLEPDVFDWATATGRATFDPAGRVNGRSPSRKFQRDSFGGNEIVGTVTAARQAVVAQQPLIPR
ncbi:MAG: hypothetical protein VX017_11085, partial [Pseudomonadota bacterium]|nr:hypothetical protein [Pseudomonadota bacterium]